VNDVFSAVHWASGQEEGGPREKGRGKMKIGILIGDGVRPSVNSFSGIPKQTFKSLCSYSIYQVARKGKACLSWDTGKRGETSTLRF